MILTSLRHTLLRVHATFIVIMGLAFCICACNDDTQFTTHSNALLTFSQDTLSFDTVFRSIVTPTKRLLVHNRNSKGVRIASVQLASGGTSGFLINVDGQSGHMVNDVAVEGNDSIFVFVKLNAPPTADHTPTPVKDTIVFTLESGVRQRVALLAKGQNMKEIHGLVLGDDTTISSEDLPLVVYDSLVVAEGKTLRIMAGTTIYFHEGANLVVRGGLSIEGSLSQPVILRGDRLDKMFAYLPYDRLDCQWGGVTLTSTCRKCHMAYADIHGGSFGIMAENVPGEIDITQSIIHNVGGYGLLLENCKAMLANSQISNARYDCVRIVGGTAQFYHCTLAQFYPWKADRGYALRVSNVPLDGSISPTPRPEPVYSEQDAQFYNCLVTGYADDEVKGHVGSNPLTLGFHYCTLRTKTSDDTYFQNCTEEKPTPDSPPAERFRTFDTHAFIYDFRLAPNNVARNSASPLYAEQWPYDRLGVLRDDTPDAGCYESSQETNQDSQVK